MKAADMMTILVFLVTSVYMGLEIYHMEKGKKIVGEEHSNESTMKYILLGLGIFVNLSLAFYCFKKNCFGNRSFGIYLLAMGAYMVEKFQDSYKDAKKALKGDKAGEKVKEVSLTVLNAVVVLTCFVVGGRKLLC